ncbi:collagenase-like [Schistocerca cancellata]|uniref:collagenase-like n=1 Tax=Schistocerca cancellata TaxID=274614 RepID=UPI002119AC16|nr:collagenase-like [Schistocerca cancellata]
MDAINSAIQNPVVDYSCINKVVKQSEVPLLTAHYDSVSMNVIVQKRHLLQISTIFVQAGETEVLIWSQVTVVPNSVCSELHEAGAITDNIMCAANTYTGVCWADLGTPLVLETEGGFKQIGVAGFLPTDGCVTGVPAGFVRVTSVLDWLATITATNFQ